MGPHVTRCQVCESPALTVRLQIGAAARLDWVFIQPSLWLELPFPQCWCFRKTLFHRRSFPCASSCFSFGSDRNHYRPTMATLFTVSDLPPVTQDVDRFFPPFIRFSIHNHLFSIGMRGVLGSIWVQPGQISSPSQNTLKHHSTTWTYSNRKWWVKGELFQ